MQHQEYLLHCAAIPLDCRKILLFNYKIAKTMCAQNQEIHSLKFDANWWRHQWWCTGKLNTSAQLQTFPYTTALKCFLVSRLQSILCAQTTVPYHIHLSQCFWAICKNFTTFAHSIYSASEIFIYEWTSPLRRSHDAKWGWISKICLDKKFRYCLVVSQFTLVFWLQA